MEHPKAHHEMSGLPEPQSLTSGRILVVDDSRMIRLTISKHLRKIGFNQIDEAEDGSSAIDQLRSGKTYDLVLLDLDMLGINGFEFLKLIKSDPALAPLLKGKGPAGPDIRLGEGGHQAWPEWLGAGARPTCP